MNALFRGGHRLNLSTEDGRNFILLEAKEIEVSDDAGKVTRYRMPVGAESDGASVPDFAWSLGFPPFGLYFTPAYAHDCGYRGTLEQWVDDNWVSAMLDETPSNELINALMFATGTPEPIRLAIYRALVAFGFKAFHDDRLAMKDPKQFL